MSQKERQSRNQQRPSRAPQELPISPRHRLPAHSTIATYADHSTPLVCRPLSTGGIALVLSGTPHSFNGLDAIGKIFFIFELVIFVVCVAAITARFVLNPGTLKNSLIHPTEALFTPTLLLSCKMKSSSIAKIGRRVADRMYSCNIDKQRPGIWRPILRSMAHDDD